MRTVKAWAWMLAAGIAVLSLSGCAADRSVKRQAEVDEMQKEFAWWPTDAQPAPVKDPKRGGYWWWPSQPGSARPWGNRGYVYVYKIIFDYQADEIPADQKMRPSLLIKKILKNVKVYFDYNKSSVRDDARKILSDAAGTLKRNPKSEILITGNCDARGSEEYNNKLGQKRAASVKKFMIESGIPEERIKIVSRGKLDAVAPIADLQGMAKDRNAQFMIAEVEEMMIPADRMPPTEAVEVEEGKFVSEEEKVVEGEVQVSTREYRVRKNDSLWKIAQKELGNGYRWKYLYELNKDRIKNPNKLKEGQTLIIPVE